MIHEDIKKGIKEAMLAKDEVKLRTLRGMSAAFTNELVAKGRKPDELLADEEALGVISRLAKQRKDSMEQFKKGNREGNCPTCLQAGIQSDCSRKNGQRGS